VGHGSRFLVTLPRDPRDVTDVDAPAPSLPLSSKVVDSSPTGDSPVNHDPAPLSVAPDQAEPG
jgi:hypothetical protein